VISASVILSCKTFFFFFFFFFFVSGGLNCCLSFGSASGGRSGRFERDLQDTVAQRVAVERLNGDEGFVVVGHGHETEAFAFVRLQVADDFDALDGAERTEQLPQDTLFRIRRQIVHENTPPSS